MKMKSILVLILALVLAAGCATTSPETTTETEETTTPTVTDGVYQATKMGRKGPLTVEVELAEGAIGSVKVVEELESEIYSDEALVRIPSDIVAAQSTNIDVVAGATFTSTAIINGVKDCIEQAGGDSTMFAEAQAEVGEKEEVTIDADFAIMGGGAAGLMAGITAAEAGKKVVIVETLGFAGGNLLSAVGVIAGPGSKVQQEYGIEMTPESYLEGKIATRAKLPLTAYYDETPELTALFYQENRIICDWITDRGIEYVEPPMGVSHTLAPGYYKGVANFTRFLVDTFEAAGGEIYYETTGTELLMNEDTVVGFKANSKTTNYTINAPATMVATGGFTTNSEMVSEIYPDFATMYSTAMCSNTGEGLEMVEAAGGVTEALDAGIHKIPVTTIGKIDIPFFCIMSNAILVNSDGERFTTEAGNPPAMMELMIKEHDGVGYFVFDEDDKELLWDTFRCIFDLGAVSEYATVEEAATDLNMPGLVAQVESFNADAVNGTDSQFSKAFNISPIEGDVVYVLPIEPGLYLTYGGVDTDNDMRALNAEGNPIEGLYVAGDITGSTEVKEGFGYTAGVTHALSFGKIAAETMLSDAE